MTKEYKSLLIRPVQLSDLDALYHLAEKTGPGMTNLQPNMESLQTRIVQSMQSFKLPDSNSEQGNYLFILENIETKAIVGCSGILAAGTEFEPFYHFKVSIFNRVSKELGISKEHKVITLVNDYHGATEIGSLFLDENLRHSGIGRLLSRSRFLFMADFPKRFSDPVIADMRGSLDKKGNSPFWDEIGSKFIGGSFNEANELMGKGEKQFISDLMPNHPIYIELLSDEAQEAVGKVHQNTMPAVKLLEKEGFKYHNYVDIFDAGPAYQCDLESIKTIGDSFLAKVIDIKEEIPSNEFYIIANSKLDFKCCVGLIDVVDENTVMLHSDAANLLNIKIGEKIRAVKLIEKVKK